MTPPPDGACQAGQRQCAGDALNVCEGGQWVATECKISCDGAKNECVTPVQIVAGFDHACARLSDGTVRCWGGDDLGQLGNEGGGSSIRPVPVPGVASAIDLTTNDSSSSGNCAVLSDKTVTCWGQLIDVTIAQGPKKIDGLAGAVHAHSGSGYMCFLSDDGLVRCKGRNDQGQLGNGGTVSSPNNFGLVLGISAQNPVEHLSASGRHACAILANSSVVCWGEGEHQENGAPEDNLDLVQATPVRGTLSASTISGVAIATGAGASCAVAADGTIQCWGMNNFGQLGRGLVSSNTTDGSTPDYVLERVGIKFIGAKKVYSDFASGFCAIKDDRTLWCWGDNRDSRLGAACGAIACAEGHQAAAYPVRVLVDNVVEAAVGFSFSCALTSESDVYCWGSNSKGQLGINQGAVGPLPPTKVVWK